VYRAYSHLGTPGILSMVECPTCARLAVFARASDTQPAFWFQRERTNVTEIADTISALVDRLAQGDLPRGWQNQPEEVVLQRHAAEQAMKLKRTYPDEAETLEEFYTRMKEDADPFVTESSQMMVDLIRYLEEHHIGADRGISTAHAQLIFQATPQSEGPSVCISAWAGFYTIEYTLPPEEAPWPYAQVGGRTRDVAEAGRMVSIAFQRAFKAG
jgi:hypothetical protein